MKTDYKDVLVHKPWGYEYLFYQNEEVAIWCLHINKGESTSLHCHPNKQTGLILISGEAVLSFLNKATVLKPGDHSILRARLFHSTKAISDDTVLLEIESPVDKDDLVRFEDCYGRKDKPYEGKDKMTQIDESLIRLENGKAYLNGCYMGFGTLSDMYDPDSVIVVLKGALKSKEGHQVVVPGDVGSVSSLKKLSGRFTNEQIQLLIICAPQHSA